MPALVQNPDTAFLNTIREFKSRLNALESRRTSGKPTAMAVCNSVQAIGAGVRTVVDLSLANWDTHGMIDTATNRMVLPYQGFYQAVVTTYGTTPSTGSMELDLYYPATTFSADLWKQGRDGSVSHVMILQTTGPDVEMQLRVLPSSDITALGNIYWYMTYLRGAR